MEIQGLRKPIFDILKDNIDDIVTQGKFLKKSNEEICIGIRFSLGEEKHNNFCVKGHI